MARMGVVLETMGESARVTTARRGVCDECDSGGACSMGGSPDGGPSEVVVARNPVGARVGDTVSFDLIGHAELQIALVVWGLPVVGLVLGAVLGGSFHDALGLQTDPASVLGAALGFGGAFGAVRLVDRRLANDRRLEPQILEIIESCGRGLAIHERPVRE